MPVIVSQMSEHHILGIPKLSSGSGSECANAVYEHIVNWNVCENIIGMCFDTTSVNTGAFNGACVLLEKKIGRSLISLACRHHIFEILLGAVYNFKLGPTSGPTVSMFVRFQKNWINIRKDNFEAGINDKFIKESLNDIGDEIIIFCQNELKKKIVRHDYKELLELTLIFLGAYTSNVSFRAPGAMHHARWMAKALYVLKILIFRKQFKLTKKEEKSLKEVSIYIIRFHIVAWFTSSRAIEAPNHDLDFVKAIYEYRKKDAEISKILISKFSNHLWYLADETIALSFFDSNVNCEEKRLMARVLMNYKDADEKPFALKRYPLKPNHIANFCKMNLNELITPNTLQFFERFDISNSFLLEDPSTWDKNENYIYGKNKLSNLQVINDNAERGVKLMEDYNQVLTRNEDDMQYILQVVSDYRKKYPESSKSCLSQNLYNDIVE